MKAEFETQVLRNMSSLHTKMLGDSKYEDGFQDELYKNKSNEALTSARELLLLYGSQVNGRRNVHENPTGSWRLDADGKQEQIVAYLELEIPNIVVEQEDGTQWNGTVWLSPIHDEEGHLGRSSRPNEFHNGIKILAQRNGTDEPRAQTPLFYLTKEGVKFHPDERAALYEIDQAKDLIKVLGSIMEERGTAIRVRSQLFTDIVGPAARQWADRYVQGPR